MEAIAIQTPTAQGVIPPCASCGRARDGTEQLTLEAAGRSISVTDALCKHCRAGALRLEEHRRRAIEASILSRAKKAKEERERRRVKREEQRLQDAADLERRKAERRAKAQQYAAEVKAHEEGTPWCRAMRSAESVFGFSFTQYTATPSLRDELRRHPGMFARAIGLMTDAPQSYYKLLAQAKPLPPLEFMEWWSEEMRALAIAEGRTAGILERPRFANPEGRAEKIRATLLTTFAKRRARGTSLERAPRGADSIADEDVADLFAEEVNR